MFKVSFGTQQQPGVNCVRLSPVCFYRLPKNDKRLVSAPGLAVVFGFLGLLLLYSLDLPPHPVTANKGLGWDSLLYKNAVLVVTVAGWGVGPM